MRVTLHQVRDVKDGRATVTFESALGWATAQWVGPRPVEGVTRHVALVIPGSLSWGYEAVSTADPDAVFEDRGRICLTGRVLDNDEDGFITLAVGDSVVPVTLSNAPGRLPKRLLVRAPTLQLFDVLEWRAPGGTEGAPTIGARAEESVQPPVAAAARRSAASAASAAKLAKTRPVASGRADKPARQAPAAPDADAGTADRSQGGDAAEC